MSTAVLDVLRTVVTIGAGLVRADGGRIVVSRPSSTGTAEPLPRAVLAGLHEHKAVILDLLAEPVVRQTWHVPDDQRVGPELMAILGWLTLERAVFTAEDYRRWLTAKCEHVDAGASSYVADILATEEVARGKLAASAGDTAALEAA